MLYCDNHFYFEQQVALFLSPRMCFTLSQWAALIHFYTSTHSYASITLANTPCSYFHQKHVNAPKSAFSTLVFLRHSRLEGRFVTQWFHYSLPSPEMAVCKLAQVVYPALSPLVHQDRKPGTRRWLVGWSRTLRVSWRVLFLGFWTSVTSCHVSLWWCCPHITPQHRPESCWTLPSWVFRSQCARVYRAAIQTKKQTNSGWK